MIKNGAIYPLWIGWYRNDLKIIITVHIVVKYPPSIQILILTAADEGKTITVL